MSKLNFAILLTCLIFCASARAQTKSNAVATCSPSAFNAMQELPKLKYECDESQSNDYDESILRNPQRLAAIRTLTKQLDSLTNLEWWRTKVAELNACDFLHKPGTLSEEEQQQFSGGEYVVRLLGNHDVRLVIVDDPCYQTGFSGSNIFLLHRSGGRVFATEIIDGYYTRADNSVSLDFAALNGAEIIEVSTSTGGLVPYVTNYYFSIDPQTQRVVSKKLFREGRRLTNKITSAMILSEAANLRLPSSGDELQIIVNKKLAPGFSSFHDDAKGRLNDNGRRLRRKFHSWNGRFYVSGKG